MPNPISYGAVRGEWWRLQRGVPAPGLGADGDYALRMTDAYTWTKVDGMWLPFTFPSCTCPGGMLPTGVAPGVATVAGVGRTIKRAAGTAAGHATVAGVGSTGAGGAASHYVITTDGNAYPNAASGTGADLAGYPLSWDLVVSLNGTGAATWGGPGWALTLLDPFSSPSGTPTVTETSRNGTSITLNVAVTNFADLYGWQVTFDGSQQVNGLTPAFIGDITSPIDLSPLPGSILTDGFSSTPFLFDPTASPPTMTLTPILPLGVQFLPVGEASNAASGGVSIIQDGGTSALTPTIAAVSTDPADGYAVTFDSGSDYTGYEYESFLFINNCLNVFGLFRIKDLNL